MKVPDRKEAEEVARELVGYHSRFGIVAEVAQGAVTEEKLAGLAYFVTEHVAGKLPLERSDAQVALLADQLRATMADNYAGWEAVAEHVIKLGADLESALAQATDSLGAMMQAIGARQILAKGISNPTIHAEMEKRIKTDDELQELAIDAFEACAMALLKIGRKP